MKFVGQGWLFFLQYFEAAFSEQKPCAGNDFVKFTEAEIWNYLNSVHVESLLGRVRSFRRAIAREENIEVVVGESLIQPLQRGYAVREPAQRGVLQEPANS